MPTISVGITEYQRDDSALMTLERDFKNLAKCLLITTPSWAKRAAGKTNRDQGRRP